jgi:hypothetical protein
MTEHQHADLLERRQQLPPATLAEALEASRQLGGANAEVVHRYLSQQAQAPNWREMATGLATELRYSMSVLALHHLDEDLDDFAWHRDGSEVLADFDAVEAKAGEAP